MRISKKTNKTEKKEVKRRGRPRKETNNMEKIIKPKTQNDFVKNSVEGLKKIAKKITETKEGICIAIYVPTPKFEDYKAWDKGEKDLEVAALIASNSNTATADIALNQMEKMKGELYSQDPMLMLKKLFDDAKKAEEKMKSEEDDDEFEW